MIQVTVHKSTLQRERACPEGLALFDSIAALQAESDPRRLRRILVRHWTPLHSVWLLATRCSFARWLEERGIVPRANLSGAYLYGANLYGANLSGAYLCGANLSGAYLSGAYRSEPSSKVPGWRTLASGYLERACPSAKAAQ